MQNRQLHSLHSIPAPAPDNDVLNLGDNLKVEPDVLLGSGIFGSGMPGSGKTSTFVLLLEEMSRFSIPLCTFDIENDIASAATIFPRGFVGTATNCPTAKDIIKGGLQVVFDLSTWSDMEARASFIARMAQSLFAYTDSLPFNHRCPVLIALDEAQMWLPQRRGDLCTPDAYKALNEAFHTIATRGRKRGLVPVLFCQKISEIAKNVLSPGSFFLLRQTVSTDQKRYLDLIERNDTFAFMSEKQIMQYIGSLPPGKAIVKLSNEQRIVNLTQRTSQHLSETPRAIAAINRYSSIGFSPDMSFGADTDDEEDLPPAATVDLDAKLSGVKRVQQLLQDPIPE